MKLIPLFAYFVLFSAFVKVSQEVSCTPVRHDAHIVLIHQFHQQPLLTDDVNECGGNCTCFPNCKGCELYDSGGRPLLSGLWPLVVVFMVLFKMPL